ncbi:hypothetical protein [Trinickia mobilis]|uniref:hypothetical protein n=1 Tax=Trinickia mobilis TaxID=2816356 RepID=UPI001A8C8BF4|nr:hypothetical protein [Trinickia mobilis]
MTANRKVRPLTADEGVIAERLRRIVSTRDAFPIRDPDLAAVMELLHRMASTGTLATLQWMAGDAIVKLRAYVVKQQAE